jgi:hypothetical protein
MLQLTGSHCLQSHSACIQIVPYQLCHQVTSFQYPSLKALIGGAPIDDLHILLSKKDRPGTPYLVWFGESACVTSKDVCH